jgi:hypothetical protein
LSIAFQPSVAFPSIVLKMHLTYGRRVAMSLQK